MSDDDFADWNPMLAFFATAEGQDYLRKTDAILADLKWIEAPTQPMTLLQTALPETAWRQIDAN